jgi:aminoglycoside phosphotransferase (APT) family kinase protein
MDPSPELGPVRPAHRFDEAALAAWLADHVEGCAAPLAVRQFAGGQSNPSVLLACGGRRLVLRKAPPGRLLPSAHRVDREHRVMTALRDTGVPVPRTLGLCEDASVIGTPFFVMEYVPGRIVRDAALPDATPAQRAAIFEALLDVLARLHAVDPAAVGLADFGKPGSYFARQVSRWSQQWALSRTHDVPAMEALLEWLPRHLPAADATALVHGDYRLGNLILAEDEPRVVAVLDWELSTLGHPLADLAYHCVFDVIGAGPEGGGAERGAGLPSEAQVVEGYARRTGRHPGAAWTFCLAFSLFRLAAITQGVYARALQGNAASDTARDAGARVALLAERALSFTHCAP